jgi:hypothetical protein
MVIAALVAFAILLVAWILAPTDAPRAQRPEADASIPAPQLDALPEAV